MSNLNAAPGALLHNLLLFGRLLRGLGLDVNPGRMIDLVAALNLIDLDRKPDFYQAARSLLIHRREDLPLFDTAFDLFWRKPAAGGAMLDLSALAEAQNARPRFAPPALPKASGESPSDGNAPSTPSDQPPILQVTVTYSERETLRHKDFEALTPEELEAVKQLMTQLAWRLGQRRTRRRRPGPGALPDLRRTLRHNLRYGGELLEWAQREPKFKPRPLVLIADISGSMERYTRLLLQFVYGLAEGLDQRVEAFVFSTRLTRITRQLRGKDVDRAVREVAQTVPDWSGGTRIGEALKTFNFEWGRRVLGGGAVVVLISDGWDRGEAAVLQTEIARLQLNCQRLIWLNPLLGSPDYEPLTRGMQTALPFIDDFLPVHNLASLEELARHLAGLDDRRPRRKQMKR